MSTDVLPPVPQRLVSLDAYRGLTMLAMASGGLGLHQVANKLHDSHSDNAVWQQIGYHFEHVEWVGCALWDLIQPSFMFMVGVAMAYSCASRKAHGQSYRRMLAHAVGRSLILVFLGIFLRSDGGFRTQTNYTFEDVLTQIGLGYTFLFLLWDRPRWVQALAAVVILVGYWALFALYPLPPADFDYRTVGVLDEWKATNHLDGFAAHWNMNTNPAADFDTWFLNLFPRKKPFVYNGGGYLTLSFIPSLATMIFGLLAGELLRSPRTNRQKFWYLVLAGVAGLALGQLLGATGLCPIVKRIWTPSWALYAGGCTLLILAAFYGVVDLLRFQRWTFPLVVVGMNSIVMYCMEDLSHPWFERTIRTHFSGPYQSFKTGFADWLPESFFEFFARDEHQPFFARFWVLVAMWLVCYWLYRQKIFVRI